MTRQGAGDAPDPYLITFRSGGTHGRHPPTRPRARISSATIRRSAWLPGQPILVRVQVVPPADSGEMPDRVAVLWRGNDAQDQLTDMVKDETGGWGGYKAVLPPQEEGAIFYQVVACDASAAKCGVDTGSKRRWHATAVASQRVQAPADAARRGEHQGAPVAAGVTPALLFPGS